MMRDHRRRSPESSRRRRKDRYSQQHSSDAPAPAPAMAPTAGPLPSYAEPIPMRTRAGSSSGASSSSSTSDSLLNISAPRTSGGFFSFFKAPPPRRRRSSRKKKKRFLRFGNSSSSSVDDALVYGKGYIPRVRGAEPYGRDHAAPIDPTRPVGTTKRAQTDEEILEIGRKLAKMAREENRADLERAGRRPHSGLVATAAAISSFRRTGTNDSVGRGLGSSRPQRHDGSSAGDSDWETSASDDEDDSSFSDDVDSGLAYGSNVALPSKPAVSKPAPEIRHAHRKSTIVDPNMFGPYNSLRGYVNTPCGFDDNRPSSSRPSDSRVFDPIPPIESASIEGRPMQTVYPVPTSDPGRFDAGRGSTISLQNDNRSSARPDPVPIQAPKPITPIRKKVFEDSRILNETRDSHDSRRRSDGPSFSEAAVAGAAGVAAGVVAAKLKESHDKEKDRKRDEDRRQRASRDDVKANDVRDDKRSKRSSKYDDKTPEELEREYQRLMEKQKELERRQKEKRRRDVVIEYDGPEKGQSKPKEKNGEDYRRIETSQSSGSKAPIDPFQFQVDEDAFETPKYGTTPQRPLTPMVVTVEREPDFTRFDKLPVDEPDERMSRKDSYEQELRNARQIYEEAKHTTAPVAEGAAAAAAAAMVVEGVQMARGREAEQKPAREHEPAPKDAVQAAADQYYRETKLAKRLKEEEIRSRSASPDPSVVEKYRDESQEPVIRIVTPPAMEHHPEKSKYDGPNADVRIDNVIQPKDLVKYATPKLAPLSRNEPLAPIFRSRDPSCERDRPLLNLVIPTPVPSPLPEKQDSRSAPVEKEPVKEAPKESEEPRSAPSVIIGPKGEIIETTETPSTPKSVTWGENETKSFVAESPEKSQQPVQDSKPATKAGKKGKKSGKSSGWGIIAAAVAGAGTAAAASAAASEDKTFNDPFDEAKSERKSDHTDSRSMSPKSVSSRAMPIEGDDVPPAPGPKPTSPHAVPGTFADDIDFAATLAAGLQESGFDPNIVIDDPTYHRRDSPPGSNLPPETAYQRPFAETVTDLGVYDEAPRGVAGPDTGFVIGEIPETPAEDRDLPAEETETFSKLSKKDKKKKQKANKRASVDAKEFDSLADEPSPVPEPVSEPVSEPVAEPQEETFEPAKLSKKEKKKRAKAAELASFEEETPSGPETTTPSEPAEVVDEWAETPSSKKKKNKKGKNAASAWEESEPNTPTAEVLDRSFDEPPGSQPADTGEADWAETTSSKKKKKGKKGKANAAAWEDSEPATPTEVFEPAVEEQPEAEPETWAETPSSSKKKGKKGKKSAFSWDDEVAEAADPVTGLVESPITAEPEPVEPAAEAGADEWAESSSSKKKKKGKKGKRASGAWDDSGTATPVDDNRVSVPVDAFDDLSREKDAQPEDDWNMPKKSKKKSKRDSAVFDSPSQSGPPSEVESTTSRKSKKGKRKSGQVNDFDVGDTDDPPDKWKERFEPLERDVSSVVSEPMRYNDETDETKSIVSVPGTGKDRIKTASKQEKRSSGGFFGLFGGKGASDKTNGSAEANDDQDGSKQSFLDNAGTLGAGVGLAGVAAAALMGSSQLSRSNATAASSEKEVPPSSSSSSTLESDPFRQERDLVILDPIVDPEIVQRAIKPAIDPQYGDLLPLPPSEPGSPTSELSDFPALPDSRPETPPEHERAMIRERLSARRRSAFETPVKSPSQTAVPLQFRLGQQRSVPPSPGVIGSSPMQSPHARGLDTSSAQRRLARPTSWDSSREIMPLYLLEHARSSSQPPEPSLLPELPPSEPPSRESPAPEYATPSRGLGLDAFDLPDTGDKPFLHIDTSLANVNRESDQLGSQETTPKAAVPPQQLPESLDVHGSSDAENSDVFEDAASQFNPSATQSPALQKAELETPQQQSMILPPEHDLMPSVEDDTFHDVEQAVELPSYDNVATPPKEGAGQEPEPVEPMSKDRSSYLLHATPPSTQKSKDGDTLGRSPSESPSQRGVPSEMTIPEESDSALAAIAALGAAAAAGGLVAAGLAHGDKHAGDVEAPLSPTTVLHEDISRELPEQDPSAVEAPAQDVDLGEVKDEQPDEWSTFTPTKKGKKGKKNRKSQAFESPAESRDATEPSTPAEPAEQQDQPSETPADDFFESKKSKKNKKKKRQSLAWEPESEESPAESPAPATADDAVTRDLEVVDVSTPAESAELALPTEETSQQPSEPPADDFFETMTPKKGKKKKKGKQFSTWDPDEPAEDAKDKELESAAASEEPKDVAEPRGAEVEPLAVAVDEEATKPTDDQPEPQPEPEDVAAEFTMTGGGKKKKKKGKKAAAWDWDEPTSEDKVTEPVTEGEVGVAKEVTAPEAISESIAQGVPEAAPEGTTIPEDAATANIEQSISGDLEIHPETSVMTGDSATARPEGENIPLDEPQEKQLESEDNFEEFTLPGSKKKKKKGKKAASWDFDEPTVDDKITESPVDQSTDTPKDLQMSDELAEGASSQPALEEAQEPVPEPEETFTEFTMPGSKKKKKKGKKAATWEFDEPADTEAVPKTEILSTVQTSEESHPLEGEPSQEPRDITATTQLDDQPGHAPTGEPTFPAATEDDFVAPAKKGKKKKGKNKFSSWEPEPEPEATSTPVGDEPTVETVSAAQPVAVIEQETPTETQRDVAEEINTAELGSEPAPEESEWAPASDKKSRKKKKSKKTLSWALQDEPSEQSTPVSEEEATQIPEDATVLQTVAAAPENLQESGELDRDAKPQSTDMTGDASDLPAQEAPVEAPLVEADPSVPSDLLETATVNLADDKDQAPETLPVSSHATDAAVSRQAPVDLGLSGPPLGDQGPPEPSGPGTDMDILPEDKSVQDTLSLDDTALRVPDVAVAAHEPASTGAVAEPQDAQTTPLELQPEPPATDAAADIKPDLATEPPQDENVDKSRDAPETVPPPEADETMDWEQEFGSGKKKGKKGKKNKNAFDTPPEPQAVERSLPEQDPLAEKDADLAQITEPSADIAELRDEQQPVEPSPDDFWSEPASGKKSKKNKKKNKASSQTFFDDAAADTTKASEEGFEATVRPETTTSGDVTQLPEIQETAQAPVEVEEPLTLQDEVAPAQEVEADDFWSMPAKKSKKGKKKRQSVTFDEPEASEPPVDSTRDVIETPPEEPSTPSPGLETADTEGPALESVESEQPMERASPEELSGIDKTVDASDLVDSRSGEDLPKDVALGEIVSTGPASMEPAQEPAAQAEPEEATAVPEDEFPVVVKKSKKDKKKKRKSVSFEDDVLESGSAAESPVADSPSAEQNDDGSPPEDTADKELEPTEVATLEAGEAQPADEFPETFLTKKSKKDKKKKKAISWEPEPEIADSPIDDSADVKSVEATASQPEPIQEEPAVEPPQEDDTAGFFMPLKKSKKDKKKKKAAMFEPEPEPEVEAETAPAEPVSAEESEPQPSPVQDIASTPAQPSGEAADLSGPAAEPVASDEFPEFVSLKKSKKDKKKKKAAMFDPEPEPEPGTPPASQPETEELGDKGMTDIESSSAPVSDEAEPSLVPMEATDSEFPEFVSLKKSKKDKKNKKAAMFEPEPEPEVPSESPAEDIVPEATAEGAVQDKSIPLSDLEAAPAVLDASGSGEVVGDDEFPEFVSLKKSKKDKKKKRQSLSWDEPEPDVEPTQSTGDNDLETPIISETKEVAEIVEAPLEDTTVLHSESQAREVLADPAIPDTQVPRELSIAEVSPEEADTPPVINKEVEAPVSGTEENLAAREVTSLDDQATQVIPQPETIEALTQEPTSPAQETAPEADVQPEAEMSEPAAPVPDQQGVADDTEFFVTKKSKKDKKKKRASQLSQFESEPSSGIATPAEEVTESRELPSLAATEDSQSAAPIEATPAAADDEFQWAPTKKSKKDKKKAKKTAQFFDEPEQPAQEPQETAEAAQLPAGDDEVRDTASALEEDKLVQPEEPEALPIQEPPPEEPLEAGEDDFAPIPTKKSKKEKRKAKKLAFLDDEAEYPAEQSTDPNLEDTPASEPIVDEIAADKSIAEAGPGEVVPRDIAEPSSGFVEQPEQTEPNEAGEDEFAFIPPKKSKKDKKKAKKLAQAISAFEDVTDSPVEVTTASEPAPEESLEQPLDTVEKAVEPEFEPKAEMASEDTKPAEDETSVPQEAEAEFMPIARKLSKKEKRQAKKNAFAWDEPESTPNDSAAPPDVQKLEAEDTPVEQAGAPKELEPLEPQALPSTEETIEPPVAEPDQPEEFTFSRKLSKKEKKRKSKQSTSEPASGTATPAQEETPIIPVEEDITLASSAAETSGSLERSIEDEDKDVNAADADDIWALPTKKSKKDKKRKGGKQADSQPVSGTATPATEEPFSTETDTDKGPAVSEEKAEADEAANDFGGFSVKKSKKDKKKRKSLKAAEFEEPSSPAPAEQNEARGLGDIDDVAAIEGTDDYFKPQEHGDAQTPTGDGPFEKVEIHPAVSSMLDSTQKTGERPLSTTPPPAAWGLMTRQDSDVFEREGHIPKLLTNQSYSPVFESSPEETKTSFEGAAADETNINLTPAQESSSVPHDPPFEQPAGPEKKVKTKELEGDAVKAVAFADEVAQGEASTVKPDTSDLGEHDQTDKHLPSDGNGPTVEGEAQPSAREIAASFLEEQSHAQDVASAEDIMADAPPAEDIFRDKKHKEEEKTTAREIAASFLEDESSIRLPDEGADKPLDKPSARDIAASFLEGSSSKKSAESKEAPSLEKKKSFGGEEAAAVISGAAGGVALLAQKFGGSKKTKKGGKKKIVDKRTNQGDDLFDDASLWEGADRKPVEGSRMDLDSAGFWDAPGDVAEAAEESMEKAGGVEDKGIESSDENGRRGGTAIPGDVWEDDYLESPVLGRDEGEQRRLGKESRGKMSTSREPTPKAEEQGQRAALPSPPPSKEASVQPEVIEEPMTTRALDLAAEEAMDIDNNVVRSIEHDDDVRSPSFSSTRGLEMSDFHRSLGSPLPPVLEEVHEDEHEEKQSRGRDRSRYLQATPDANRDSGYMAESPEMKHPSHFDPDSYRDSGVHLREYPDSPRARDLRRFSPEPSRLSHSSTEGAELHATTPSHRLHRSDDRRAVRRSPLAEGDYLSRDKPETPKLREPAALPHTPEPQKLDRSGKKRSSYKELGGLAAAAGAPLAGHGAPLSSAASSSAHRSVSDNIREKRQSPGPEMLGRRSASNTSISRLRTPEPLNLRPDSPGSMRSWSGTPPLRRVDKRVSGDLRSLSQRSDLSTTTATTQKEGGGGGPLHPGRPVSASPAPSTAASAGASAALALGAGAALTAAALSSSSSPPHHQNSSSNNNTPTPVANEGRVRAKDMTDVYDGYGEGRIGSPRSPTRPHSMRRRQSMQVLELESRVEQLIAENRALADARAHAEHSLSQKSTSALAERDDQIEVLKRSLELLQKEVARLTEVNEGLQSAINTTAVQHNDRYRRLETQHADTSRELEQIRGSHGQHTQTLQEKDAEIADLRAQLEATKDQIRDMQRQILASKSGDSAADYLTIHDVDYFDHRCQQLCSHVQQWVLRFSKFSDMRACRLTSEINDEKIIDRLDNAVLDGSDVDTYLNDRVRRRDIFMSMTMTMIWEFVFTRYLFGMDREQRQKLKSLEKLLLEVGPPHAVRQWRAVTLTLLSRRDAFRDQRDQDTEAVVQAVFQTLSVILPPPSNLEDQIQAQLRRVMREAVELSVEMRTQRAEYMMLPPLQPEYDANGDLAEQVAFNASLMNERSSSGAGGAGAGGAATNEELEARAAIVRVVLFPLVVRKGDDAGVGDDEIVVCPAQVLVAKPHTAGKRPATAGSSGGGGGLHASSAAADKRLFTPSSDAGGASLFRSSAANASNVSMADAPSPQPLPEAAYLEGGI
ncbi:uncharacterized protein E0L32_000570 [Thyridium curvatum]|uniref:Involucrin repeat protein n=1 Tax=Thyridium curvatum TaxID=1093900 RepID=A0A507B510_9PEZI|nr:uncharacterized protein E0L32_000570 [Thyridium curvatum]TPX14176.1 hypothetical protein E0L32_000570 [Thyridium curvatum]